jgi:wyosine [tRNA(Phe)-imidazoG37] synthetase (radical SAM superfamily)
VSNERGQLENQLDELVGCIDRLASVLARYRDAASDLSAKVHAGAPVSEALTHTGEPTLRPVLARTLGAFMHARSRTRLGLLTTAVAEGEPVPDVRRALHPQRPAPEGGAGATEPAPATPVADGAADTKPRPAQT